MGSAVFLILRGYPAFRAVIEKLEKFNPAILKAIEARIDEQFKEMCRDGETP